MTKLKDILQSKEQVIEKLSGVKYQNQEYNCAITNVRTLLYEDELPKFTEIKHESVDDISLEKGWYIDLIYLIPISFCLAFICLFLGFITYFPLGFTPANIDLLRAFLYPGIVFTAIGIAAVYIYFTQVKFSAILSESKDTYQLFSNYETIVKFIRITKGAKSGKFDLLKTENPLEFTQYQILISKIVIVISTFFFILVGWFGPTFQDIFYVPFLLLIIGFIIGLSGYNEDKINPILFKLGFIVMFIGMNFMWFLIYENFLSTPGLITLLLGVGLFLYC